ncbi:hypothetical protein [Sorangium sp. So ce131]|uniref:hypothetical protein n=1 Tax=Sorangium sp. So ce131 TaxID=3133282 RepID=UPI003F632449
MPTPTSPLLRRAARSRLAAALARSLAVAALAAPAAGCLVLSAPEYEEPAQTAPALMATSPDVFRPIYITELIKSQEIIDFGATVLSEDNGAPVQVYLYIDYGKRTRANRPFRRSSNAKLVSAGTIAEGKRSFQASWFYEPLPDAGEWQTAADKCHTITMMASHEFNPCDCPRSPRDMGWLTWQLIDCDPNAVRDPNDTEDLGCPTSCPALECEPGTADEPSNCLWCEDPLMHQEDCEPE